MRATIGHRLLAWLPGRVPSLTPRRALALALAAAGLLALPLWLGQRLHAPADRQDGGPPFRATTGVASDRPLSMARAPGAPAPSAPAPPWARRILRQAVLELELRDVDRALAQLGDLVEAAGGYVADTQTRADATGVVRATLTAYVPPGAFAATLREVEQVGRVTARRIAGQDVSEEFVDLEARLRNFERHEAQLVGFMGKARDVAELVSLESELARVRGEIERTTGRLRFLRGRTEMAAIQVGLARVGAAAPGDGLAPAWERIRRDFVAGWRAAFEVAVGLAALAAQWSPLAIPAAAAWAGYRRLRRPVASPAPTVPS